MTSFDVADYGILTNNTPTENDLGFANMREALLAIQTAKPSIRLTINMDAGRYQYTNNRWLMGLNHVEVMAWGTELQCQEPSGGGESWALSLATLFHDTEFETNTQHKVDLHLIKTALAGSIEIEFTDPADIASYAQAGIGARMLIFGFNQQTGGFPPNARYFEIVTITTVDEPNGILGLSAPLRQSYHDDWPDIPYSAGIAGAARAILLDRYHNSTPYTYPEYVAIRGATIVEGASAVSTKVHLTARHIVLEGVKNAHISPTEAESFIVDGCELIEIEVDKLIRTCQINNSLVLGRLGGATGCDHLRLYKTTFNPEQGVSFDFHGRRMTMQDCELYSPPNGQSNWWGLSLDHPCDQVVIENCLIDDRNNAADFFIHEPGHFSILVDEVGEFGEILIDGSDAQKLDNWRKLDYGMKLTATTGQTDTAFTQSDNSGLIQSLYQDSQTRLVIKGTWKHFPVAGQIWTYSILKKPIVGKANVLKGKLGFTLSSKSRDCGNG